MTSSKKTSSETRRTFGPVVLVGLAAAGLTAVAAAKTWAFPSGDDASAGHLAGATAVSSAGEVPLASALALVVLAAWGVLLVTRGRVRRVVAVVGLAAAAGVVATVVYGLRTLPAGIRDEYAAIGVPEVDVHFGGWLWAALIGSLLSVAALALAVRFAPSWPEMGSRYDAPGAAGSADRPEEPESNLDIWKALDEGRDPTE